MIIRPFVIIGLTWAAAATTAVAQERAATPAAPAAKPQKDRYQRYLAWCDKYVKGAGEKTAAPPGALKP